MLLLPLLALVTGVELWMTRHDALEAANAAYDRSLLGALKSIDANISTASGGLSAELPYSMLEFFELTASGNVYFRVASSDGLVELGNADLPFLLARWSPAYRAFMTPPTLANPCGWPRTAARWTVRSLHPPCWCRWLKAPGRGKTSPTALCAARCSAMRWCWP